MAMFKTKTVDSILGVFTKTIQELKVHAAESAEKALKLNEQATALRRTADDHTLEAFKAKTAHEKLEKFLGTSE